MVLLEKSESWFPERSRFVSCDIELALKEVNKELDMSSYCKVLITCSSKRVNPVCFNTKSCNFPKMF